MPCHFEKIMKRLDRKRASSHGSREASLHLLSPSLGPALGRIHLVVVLRMEEQPFMISLQGRMGRGGTGAWH